MQTTESLFEGMNGRTLDVRSHEWQELGRFLKRLRDLDSAVSAVRPPASVENLLRSSKRIRRVLMGSPVRADSCREILRDGERARQDSSGRQLAGLVEALLMSAEDLFGSINPFSSTAIDFITQDPGLDVLSGIVPALVLVVDAEARDLTKTWLLSEDLIADVVSVTEVKKLGSWTTAILFGLPENHVWSFDAATKADDAGWLVSAGPGTHLVVVIGPGCNAFKSDRYAPWRGTDAFSMAASPPSMFVDLVADMPRSWVPAVPQIARVESEGPRPEVVAIPLALAGGGWVFFDKANQVGPKPRILQEADGSVEFKAVKVEELSEGNIVILPVSRAERDYLRDSARVSLTRRHGENCDCLERAGAFKLALQKLSNQADGLEKLQSAGMSPTMARKWLQHIWDDSAIAMQDASDVEKAARAADIPFSKKLHSSIRDVRTAMRQAGHNASRELRDELSRTTDWRDAVQTGQLVRLQIEGVGEILVASLAAVMLDEEQSAPISSLGRFIDDSGREVEAE